MEQAALAQALRGDGGAPPAPPSAALSGGPMSPQQAMSVLAQLGVTPDSLPMVVQAVQALQGGATAPLQAPPGPPQGMPPGMPPGA